VATFLTAERGSASRSNIRISKHFYAISRALRRAKPLRVTDSRSGDFENTA